MTFFSILRQVSVDGRLRWDSLSGWDASLHSPCQQSALSLHPNFRFGPEVLINFTI